MEPQSGSQQCPTKLLTDALQAGAARGELAMRELHELKRTNHSLLSDCKGLAGQLAQVSRQACLCCQDLLRRPVEQTVQRQQREWCEKMDSHGKTLYIADTREKASGHIYSSAPCHTTRHMQCRVP